MSKNSVSRCDHCRLLVAAALSLSLMGCAATLPPRPHVEVYAEINDLPGNIAVTPDNRVLVSIHQFRPGKHRVVEVRPDGAMRPFPNEEWNLDGGGSNKLDTVLGLRCDHDGVVWLLDNGMRGKSTPKLVGWDTRADRLKQVITLAPPITVADSFVNDLQIDDSTGTIFIADPAGGANAAIIVVDIARASARRVLEGHVSVIPENVDLIVDARVVQLTPPGSRAVPARIGVNPIALDSKNEWLYFGPMSGLTMYRARTSDLRDAALTFAELEARVEAWAVRPCSDGITMDSVGNVYVTDLAADAIGVIPPDGRYRRWMVDARFSWPDAFSFGPDGWVYLVTNQLHRTPPLNGGADDTRGPYPIFRFRPLAAGVVGR